MAGIDDHAPALLTRRCNALIEPEMRRQTVARNVAQLDDRQLADLLGYLALNAEDPAVRVVQYEIVSLVSVDQICGYERENAVREMLSGHPNAPIFDFLGMDPLVRRAGGGYRENPYDFEDVPLGRRKANARLHNRDLLSKLTGDPSPEVMAILLQNPMTIESDIIRTVAQRPQAPLIFKEILRSHRFGGRERVLFAICANPYCPVRYALGIQPLISSVGRRELAMGTGLDDRVRKAALGMIVQGGRAG